MRRMIGRFTELQVRRVGRGWHNDGGGLYLRVEGRQQRWWVFRYGKGGKRYHGLGPLLDGADPISAGRRAAPQRCIRSGLPKRASAFAAPLHQRLGQLRRAPSRIARQFGISQSDVRKVLASEPRRAGKGR
jgi:hypothetical protein